MTYRELRRKLESLGCGFKRQADGSHEQFFASPTTELGKQGPKNAGTSTVNYLNQSQGEMRRGVG